MIPGSVVIDFGRGWACSNEVTFVVERDLITLPDGSKASKHVNTLRVLACHNVIGELKKEDKLECVFKIDESGDKKGYTAEVNAMTAEMMILKITSIINNPQEIIKKIGGYQNGK